MKQEVPKGAIVAAIVAVLAVVFVGIFFAIKKGDPAAQAPNPPPTFDPAQKAAESKGAGGISFERGPASASEPQKPAPTVQ